MKPKIFIAIPVYGGVPNDFMQCLLKLQAAPPCDIEIAIAPGDSLVCRARNTLTAQFLKSDCTHLLFIDSDLIFSSEQIARLLNHEKCVVAGFYPKKKDGDLEWVCNRAEPCPAPDENGLQEMRYMGTGFILVRRAVFEQMIEIYGKEMAYCPDPRPKETEWDFWPVGVYRSQDGFQRYLSEDWYFCQRWLDMGGKVFGDTRVILRHVGQAVYPLQSQMAALTAGVHASACPPAPGQPEG